METSDADKTIELLLNSLEAANKAEEVLSATEKLAMNIFENSALWTSMSSNLRQRLQDVLLRRVAFDMPTNMIKPLIEAYAIIAYGILTDTTWPELFERLMEHRTDDPPSCTPTRLCLMGLLMARPIEQVRQHLTQFLAILIGGMSDVSLPIDARLTYLGVVTTLKHAYFSDASLRSSIRSVVPAMVDMWPHLLSEQTSDPEIQNAIDVFSEWAGVAGFFSAHFASFCEAVLPTLEDPLRYPYWSDLLTVVNEICSTDPDFFAKVELDASVFSKPSTYKPAPHPSFQRGPKKRQPKGLSQRSTPNRDFVSTGEGKPTVRFISQLLELMIGLLMQYDNTMDADLWNLLILDQSLSPSDSVEDHIDRFCLTFGSSTDLPMEILSNITSLFYEKHDASKRHAAMWLIVLCIEGCGESLIGAVPILFQMAISSLQFPDLPVRLAALNAVGQLATDFHATFAADHGSDCVGPLLSILDDDSNPRLQTLASQALLSLLGSVEDITEDRFLPLLSNLKRVILIAARWTPHSSCQPWLDKVKPVAHEMVDVGYLSAPRSKQELADRMLAERSSKMLALLQCCFTAVADGEANTSINPVGSMFTELWKMLVTELELCTDTLSNPVHVKLRSELLKASTAMVRSVAPNEVTGRTAVVEGYQLFIRKIMQCAYDTKITPLLMNEIAPEQHLRGACILTFIEACSVLGDDVLQDIPIFLPILLQTANTQASEFTRKFPTPIEAQELVEKGWELVPVPPDRIVAINMPHLMAKQLAISLFSSIFDLLGAKVIQFMEPVLEAVLPCLEFPFRTEVVTAAATTITSVFSAFKEHCEEQGTGELLIVLYRRLVGEAIKALEDVSICSESITLINAIVDMTSELPPNSLTASQVHLLVDLHKQFTGMIELKMQANMMRDETGVADEEEDQELEQQILELADALETLHTLVMDNQEV